MSIQVLLSKSVPFVIIIALFSLISIFQKQYDDLGPPFTTRLTLAKRNLLQPTILPYINFGFSNILADAYWIRAIQDFVAWNGKEGFYIGYFRNIATLDPKFEYPYLFSILTVPQSAHIVKEVGPLNDIAVVAETGIKAIPSSWQIPFYLGTQYYIFTKQKDPAVKYLALAAANKDAPDGTSLVYASIISKGTTTKESTDKNSRELIKVIYNNTDNEIIKKLAGKGLEEAIITQALEKGILAYKAKFNRYPRDVDEILSAHFASLPDAFLENFIIEINQLNGSFRITERE